MKMKRRYIKKLDILNRPIHIKNYRNYLIYNYLNNYNLKFFIYFIKNKNYLFKNKNYLLLLQKQNLILKFALYNQLYFIKSKFYTLNGKDKFYSSNEKKTIKQYYFNNKIELSKNKDILNKNTLYLTNINNTIHIDINNVISVINLNEFYKELFIILFLLNILKIFEFYKSLMNLVYIKSLYL